MAKTEKGHGTGVNNAEYFINNYAMCTCISDWLFHLLDISNCGCTCSQFFKHTHFL